MEGCTSPAFKIFQRQVRLLPILHEGELSLQDAAGSETAQRAALAKLSTDEAFFSRQYTRQQDLIDMAMRYLQVRGLTGSELDRLQGVLAGLPLICKR